MQVDEKTCALEQLYRDRYRTFRDVLAGIVGSHDLAREVVQEAFARALRERRRFRGEGSLEAWVWKKGGFCEQWSNLTGGCRAGRHDRFARRIDVSGMYVGNRAGSSLVVLGGSFFQRAAARLELVYADGTTTEIPFVWSRLWVAPTRPGGTCYWTDQASGCPRPRSESHAPPPLGLGFSGAATHVTLCCTAGRDVTRVEARFQDGDRVELTPRECYLVWPVPSRHYPRRHRLQELVAFDASDHQIATQQVKTDAAGLYPCSTPKRLGYGVSMCP